MFAGLKEIDYLCKRNRKLRKEIGMVFERKY